MARPVPRCARSRGSLPNASQRPRASLRARVRAQKLFDWTEFERRRDCPLGNGDHGFFGRFEHWRGRGSRRFQMRLDDPTELSKSQFAEILQS